VPESEVLPIPEAGRGLTVDPETGYALEEIADGTWIITDGFYVCMFVVTSEGVVLFDAPPSLTVRPPDLNDFLLRDRNFFVAIDRSNTCSSPMNPRAQWIEKFAFLMKHFQCEISHCKELLQAL
jgi:hypothetical protein